MEHRDQDYRNAFFECFERRYLEWEKVPAVIQSELTGYLIKKTKRPIQFEFISETQTADLLPGILSKFMIGKMQYEDFTDALSEALVNGAIDFAEPILISDFNDYLQTWKEEKAESASLDALEMKKALRRAA